MRAMNEVLSVPLLFCAVLVLNLMPAFAPPTWMLLTFWGFHRPEDSPWLLAVLAATAASLGRVGLARMAQAWARSRWMSAARRDNLQSLAQLVDKRRGTSALSFLLFAFSPLPSNVLFLAYGLTRAPLWLLVLPFFIGRFVSYGLALAGGAYAAEALQAQIGSALPWIYFVTSQSLMLLAVWGFSRVNWRRVLPARWLD